jgi:uncharacterized protein YecE (DUF72 family)
VPAPLTIGTSSWSAPSWEGVFYPRGTPPGEYLSYYATRFATVEIDATFYRIPSATMVDAWRERTPPGFVFAAKMPQAVTHEKGLVDCGEECAAFFKAMERLGDKLGPLLLQFRYFRKAELPSPDPFLDRLEAFLPTLPSHLRFAVEVRNKNLVNARLLDLLARHRIALAFIDHPWFHRIGTIAGRAGILTTDFAYLRWLGDRRGIEAKTTTWDRLIVDRTREMGEWIPVMRDILLSGRTIHGYFNNHYAGYAVGSIERFREMWEAGGDPAAASAPTGVQTQ